MASSVFMRKPPTISIHIPTKEEVEQCIDRYQESADRYADSKANIRYNKETTIHVELSDFMKTLKKFCNSLKPGLLNSKEVLELARILKPVADAKRTPKPYKEYDYWACENLISKMPILIKHANSPDVFNVIVNLAYDSIEKNNAEKSQHDAPRPKL